jgi:hypothetical protein
MKVSLETFYETLNYKLLFSEHYYEYRLEE